MIRIGTKVVKNPKTWNVSEFDLWGAGVGVGEVVEILDETSVDVRWPAGRAYQDISELVMVD